MSRLTRFMLRIPGQLYLWLAISIFGAANSVTRKLAQLGTQHFINGRNPISLCNVLFVGNLCALLVLEIVYQQQLRPTAWRRISRQEWLGAIAVAILAGAIAPSLIFQALALTTVNNVVLVGRLETSLSLILSIWLLQERVNLWEILGAFVSFVGVMLAIFLTSPGQGIHVMTDFFHIGTGEIFTATAALVLASATIISKLRLSRVPLGIYNILRTALGTVIFFFAALLLYGKHHFMDAFSPFLWQWMLVYGSIVVVVGQSFWTTGLRATSVSEASLVGSFTPIAGILSAYLILDEVPTLGQYIGGSIILIGVFLSQIGIWRKASIQSATSQIGTTSKLQEVESRMGFKGI